MNLFALYKLFLQPKYSIVNLIRIQPEEWQAVQLEIDKRKKSGRNHRNTSPFSGKLFCGDCGEIFGSKTWHSTDKYRRVMWQCNAKFRGDDICKTPHLYKETLKEMFLDAMAEYLKNREQTISTLRTVNKTLNNTNFIDAEIENIKKELALTSEMIRVCIEGNATNNMTEEEYNFRHTELIERYEKQEEKLNALTEKREKMKRDAIAIGGLLFELSEIIELPIAFDEKWSVILLVQSTNTLKSDKIKIRKV